MNVTTVVYFTFYFVLGTAIGSFLNVWSRRLLRGKPPTGRSHCESCGRVLSPLDLIPILSFVFLRGRCRYCHKPLSWQYPLVEGFTGLLFAVLGVRSGFPVDVIGILLILSLLIASSTLVVVFVTDFFAQKIFDQVLWVGFFAAVIYRITVVFSLRLGFFSFVFDLLGALGFYLFLQLIRSITRKKGLGDGDPLLGFVSAFLVGFPLLFVEIFLAFTLGGIVGTALVVARVRGLKDRIAFGPFLVVSVFATLLFGGQIWVWYTNLLGF